MLRDLVGVPQFNALTLAQLGAYGTATLQEIPAASFGTLTLGQLQVGTLADLVGWPALVDLRLTIAELLALVPQAIKDGLTLGGLLQGVVPVADYPWEDLDLAAASRELAGDGGVVSFDIEVTPVSPARPTTPSRSCCRPASATWRAASPTTA